MILTGESEVLEKNIVQRRWLMNECIWSSGGMILAGETEVLGEKHYTVSVVDELINMEH